MSLAPFILTALGALALLIGFFVSAGRREKIDSPIFQDWGKELREASKKTGVPIEIIAGVLWRESVLPGGPPGGDPLAVGDNGASIGLMQIKSIAMQDLVNEGIATTSVPPFDPRLNILYGAEFLALIKKRSGMSWFNVLRSYNCCGTNFGRVMSNPDVSKGYAQAVMKKARELGYVDPFGLGGLF